MDLRVKWTVFVKPNRKKWDRRKVSQEWEVEWNETRQSDRVKRLKQWLVVSDCFKRYK
jgi:hypothetical protein